MHALIYSIRSHGVTPVALKLVYLLSHLGPKVGYGELSAFGSAVAKRIFRRFAVSTKQPGDKDTDEEEEEEEEAKAKAKEGEKSDEGQATVNGSEPSTDGDETGTDKTAAGAVKSIDKRKGRGKRRPPRILTFEDHVNLQRALGRVPMHNAGV